MSHNAQTNAPICLAHQPVRVPPLRHAGRGTGGGVLLIALTILFGCDELKPGSAAVMECTTLCPEGAECIEGDCVCDEGDLCDGVCVETEDNPNHCGQCDNTCQGELVCVEGTCQCPPESTLCGDRCVDVQSDGTHCGACDSPCPEGAGCVEGGCACEDDQMSLCDGECVATDEDPRHCGACDNPCPEGVGCMEGECRCTLDEELCDDGCHELEWDEENCGACGVVCGGGQVCCDGLCADECPCEEAHRDRSHVGCEFWAVELDNRKLLTDPTATPEAPFAIVLFNPQIEPARVAITMGFDVPQEAIPSVDVRARLQNRTTQVRTEILSVDGQPLGVPLTGTLEDIEVPPGATLQVLLPRQQPERDTSSIEEIGWRVVSDRPVVAYQFNPICCNYSFTNDASILLPVSAWTRHYMALSYPHWSREETGFEGPSTLTVVASRDDTQVEVRLGDTPIYPGARVPFPDPSGTFRVRMRAGEVLSIQTRPSAVEADPSGVEIESSKPVAAFSSHACTFIPRDDLACDHLEHQLFGVETWGKRHVAAPLKLRGRPGRSEEAVYWKFVARLDATRIELHTPLEDLAPVAPSTPDAEVPDCRQRLVTDRAFELNKGERCEFGTQQAFVAVSDKPVLLGGFLSGQASTGTGGGLLTGDPAFFLVAPQEQHRDSYAFLTPSTYDLDFVTLTMTPGAELVLDDAPVDLSTLEVIDLPGQDVRVVHLPVEDGPHTLASSAPFGLVVYAYDDFVSYAYTGGLGQTRLAAP